MKSYIFLGEICEELERLKGQEQRMKNRYKTAVDNGWISEQERWLDELDKLREIKWSLEKFKKIYEGWE